MSSSSGSASIYANLQPRYRLADQVPDKQKAVQASRELDAKLTGANPIDVLIEFPTGQSLYAPQTLATIAEVHSIVEKQAGVGNVWSLETLRRWLAEKIGKSDVATLKQYVDFLPHYLVQRFISQDSRMPSLSRAACPISTRANCCPWSIARQKARRRARRASGL